MLEPYSTQSIFGRALNGEVSIAEEFKLDRINELLLGCRAPFLPKTLLKSTGIKEVVE